MRRWGLAVLLTFVSGAWRAWAASCSVSSSNVAFNLYSGSTIDVTGTLTVNCTAALAYQVGIGAGTGSGATVTNRSMTGFLTGAQLGYGLYRDSAHALNWGNTPGADTVSGTGTGANQTVTVYAELPAGEFAPVDYYIDSTLDVYVTAKNVSTATTTFNVTALLIKACSITATSLNFGVYTGVLIDSTSTISATCTSGTAYNVGLDAGQASGATVTNRSMTGPGASLLKYQLFRDSGHTSNWGNTVGTDTASGTGTGTVQSLTVYGQVPAGQALQPGSYTDTITATVTY